MLNKQETDIRARFDNIFNMLSVKHIQLDRFDILDLNGLAHVMETALKLYSLIIYGNVFCTRLDEILAAFSYSLSIDTIVITALPGYFKNTYT